MARLAVPGVLSRGDAKDGGSISDLDMLGEEGHNR
jgi:hypothetical protein